MFVNRNCLSQQNVFIAVKHTNRNRKLFTQQGKSEDVQNKLVSETLIEAIIFNKDKDAALAIIFHQQLYDFVSVQLLL